MRRPLRIMLTVVVSAVALVYILLKIDVHETARIIGRANLMWVALSISLIFLMVVPMAWRWQLLLGARAIHERLTWLVRTYFVSLTVGQVLPTSVGGDASRIYETARRHPGQGGTIAASVLVERALGGVVTLLLAAVGLAFAIGRYSIAAYLWVELVLVAGAIVLGFVFFSTAARRRLRIAAPVSRKLRVERLAREIYEGIHGYRHHRGTLGIVLIATVVVQLGGILSIYAAGRAVGINVSLLVYIVLGPLLFLVMLLPFTINGLGIREAFFVAFLAKVGIASDAAFACGFIFFLTSLVLALPGLVVIVSDGIRRRAASDARV